jgi:predicted Zn-dependent peptidase
VPSPIVRRLDNGLEVAVFPRHRLSIVQVQLMIPAGVAHEPEGASGVANATVQMLRQGTTSRSAPQFESDLDGLGGTITAVASRDFSTLSGQFLARDFAAGLELMADAVLHPLFRPDEIDRFKAITSNALVQLRQNPNVLADDQTWIVAMEGHRYGRPQLGTLESVARISRDALTAFHRDHYRPGRALLVIAGDVDPEQAFAAARDGFGSWAGRAAGETVAPEIPKAPTGVRIRIVDRPGQAQTELRVALLAPARGTPEFPALQLANHLLGGGYLSRLTRSMRSTDGLSYDARSSYTALMDAGLLTVSTFTRSDSAAIVVSRIREELRRLATSPPDEAEVEAGRRYFRRVYPLQFETIGALAGQWLTARFYGQPEDGIASSFAQVASVSSDQVKEAIQRWLDPDRAVVIAVGPAAELEALLEPLGRVEVISPDRPAAAVAAKATAPTSAAAARGREVVARALAAHGGLAKLRGIKDSVVDGEMSVGTSGMTNAMSGKLEQVRKEPFKMVLSTEFAAFSSQQVLNGRRAWQRISAGDSVVVTESDSALVLGLRSGFGSDVAHLLLAAADTASRAHATGRDFVDGRPVDAVELHSAAGEERRMLFDVATHRLLAMEQVRSSGGGFVQRRVYKDYRPVGGVLWPYYEERFVNGQRIMTQQLRAVRTNVGITDARFEQPAEPRPVRGR